MRTGSLFGGTVPKFTDFPHKASCKYCLWFYSNLFWICSRFALNSQSPSLKLTKSTNMAKIPPQCIPFHLFSLKTMLQNSWKILLFFGIGPSNQLLPIANITCPHNRWNLIFIPGPSKGKTELRLWALAIYKDGNKNSEALSWLFSSLKHKAYHTCQLKIFRSKNHKVKWQSLYGRHHLIPSFLTQILIYLTALLRYFQMTP